MTDIIARLSTPDGWAELRTLAEKATPGPWVASGVTSKINGTRFMFVNVEPLGEVARLPLPDRTIKGYAPTICDQHFIAAASPDVVLSLIARLEALEAEKWQPIETAPKDNTPLLLCDINWKYFDKPQPVKVGGWDVEGNRWHIFGASWTPTHWMPLPAPPSVGAGNDRQNARTAIQEPTKVEDGGDNGPLSIVTKNRTPE